MRVDSLRIGGLEFEVAEAGRGGRPLLLVHGFTGAKEDFADWLDAFAAEGWWVVAPDLRGHGASAKPDTEDQYSVAIFAADLLGLVDALGWSSFSLLGHSMGGMVAQEMALDLPERVERLVLMDTHHGAVGGLDPAIVEMGVEHLRAHGLPAFLELLDSLPSERAAADERVRASRPGYTEWNERKRRGVAPAMYAAMAMALIHRPDHLARLASISIPTRVVVGEQDRPFVGAAHRMAHTIPGADLVVIPDAAHCPQFENPDAWWQAVASFLDVGHLID